MTKVNKLEGVVVLFPASEITLLLSDLVLFPCDTVMVLTGMLSHLHKMNTARYITHDLGFDDRSQINTPWEKVVRSTRKRQARKANTVHSRPRITSGVRRA